MQNSFLFLKKILPHRQIAINLKLKFRGRLIEWLATIQLTFIGWVLLIPENTFFQNPGYAAMANWGSETTWGVSLLFVGVLGAVGLFINGAMSAVTPWIRVFRAAIGALAFSLLAVGTFIAWVVHENPPSTDLGVYLPAVVFEFVSIYNAVVDARMYQNGRRNAEYTPKFNS